VLPELRVSPGLSTVLLFDTPLGQVELANAERFGRVRVAGDTLTLVPSDGLEAGARVRLTVRFEDGAAPARATLVLVVHPALAERQVEVHRRPRPLESYQRELKALRAENQGLRQEVERLNVSRARLDGLTDLLVDGHLAYEGVACRRINAELDEHPRSALRVQAAWAYRAVDRLAVALVLEGPNGAQPWRAEGAALVATTGPGLKVLSVWQAAPIEPGSPQRVMVEADATQMEARGPFTLTLWEAGGTRPVTLGNVTFP
jgi:uncharacterized protein (TIGR02268 family)